MRNRNTIEYLGIWETLYNPDFKPIEFDRFKNEAGLNAFTLSPQKWIEATNSKGMISKSGRYGGTFAPVPTDIYNIIKSIKGVDWSAGTKGHNRRE